MTEHLDPSNHESPDESWDTQYRRGVGMILLNKHNQVFVGQRLDNRQEAWQMPQGGIDRKESPDQAMLRELQEETGTRNVEIIAKSSKWYRYDLPDDLGAKLWGGRYKGQQQIWYLLRFRGEDKEINIHTHHPEFRSWKWVDKDEIMELIVPFKKELYNQILSDLWPFVLRKSREH